MADDPRASEKFIRVIGKRQPAPIGVVPSAENRAAMTAMAGYRMRVPKGVFIYRSHEEANRDRDRWLLETMAAVAHTHA